MVPVIRNVEGMNFTDIEKAINLLGEKVILSAAYYDTFEGRFVINPLFFLLHL